MEQGDVVEDFDLVDQHGAVTRLGELVADGTLVLFFYPKAMTPGCTKESCHFRDLRSEFAELGAKIVGVSADPVDRQMEFDERNGLGFPLLSGYWICLTSVGSFPFGVGNVSLTISAPWTYRVA